MLITYFHWAKNSPPSIGRSFRPLINKISQSEEVKEFWVPFSGANPINIIKNIWFVFKHRNKKGINHITGDIHYCVLGLIGCKSVLTIHDDYAIIKDRKGWLGKLYKYLFWIFLPIKLADRTVYISEATKNKIDKLVACKNSTVISNHSVDSEFIYQEKVLNTKSPLILQIGTSMQKNLETTIKAIANLNKEGFNCRLRVIKKMTDEQHALAKELSVNYSNAYDLSDKEIVEEYKNADVIAFPSLYEGFGMPIIEGQATGRVVITSNIPPMNWVAGENGAMLLDNPRDVGEYTTKLKNILNNNKLHRNLVEIGYKNSKRFTVQNAVRLYYQLYEDLLNN